MLDYIEKTWNSFVEQQPIHMTFLEDDLATLYSNEEKTASVFSIFSILAIFIASLGLFGLTLYHSQKRIRESGIRKVMGASVARITVLLSSEFMRWVVIANLVAWPVAWLVMDRWLQNFALRTSQDPVFFVLSAAAALFIALLTVSVLSVRAASASPIKALRYE